MVGLVSEQEHRFISRVFSSCIYLTSFPHFPYFITVDLKGECLPFRQLFCCQLTDFIAFAVIIFLIPSPFKEPSTNFVSHFLISFFTLFPFFLAGCYFYREVRQLRFLEYLRRLWVNRCLKKPRVESHQSMTERVTTRSSSQLMSLRRAFLVVREGNVCLFS